MPTFDTARIMGASASEAWAILIDTQRWTEWGPSIVAVESSSRFIRAGLRGKVRTFAGLWLPFEIVAFEDGRRWSWRVAGAAATGHRVEPMGPRRCRVVFEVPWPLAPYALVCQLALVRIARLLA